MSEQLSVSGRYRGTETAPVALPSHLETTRADVENIPADVRQEAEAVAANYNLDQLDRERTAAAYQDIANKGENVRAALHDLLPGTADNVIDLQVRSRQSQHVQEALNNLFPYSNSMTQQERSQSVANRAGLANVLMMDQTNYKTLQNNWDTHEKIALMNERDTLHGEALKSDEEKGFKVGPELRKAKTELQALEQKHGRPWLEQLNNLPGSHEKLQTAAERFDTDLGRYMERDDIKSRLKRVTDNGITNAQELLNENRAQEFITRSIEPELREQYKTQGLTEAQATDRIAVDKDALTKYLSNKEARQDYNKYERQNNKFNMLHERKNNALRYLLFRNVELPTEVSEKSDAQRQTEADRATVEQLQASNSPDQALINAMLARLNGGDAMPPEDASGFFSRAMNRIRMAAQLGRNQNRLTRAGLYSSAVLRNTGDAARSAWEHLPERFKILSRRRVAVGATALVFYLGGTKRPDALDTSQRSPADHRNRVA